MAPRHTLNDHLLAERHRIDTILTSSAALARPQAARKLALEHGMQADAAIELLASLPSEESPYVQALSRETIGISPAGGADPLMQDDPKAARRAEIAANMATYNRRKGYVR